MRLCGGSVVCAFDVDVVLGGTGRAAPTVQEVRSASAMRVHVDCLVDRDDDYDHDHDD